MTSMLALLTYGKGANDIEPFLSDYPIKVTSIEAPEDETAISDVQLFIRRRLESKPYIKYLKFV